MPKPIYEPLPALALLCLAIVVSCRPAQLDFNLELVQHDGMTFVFLVPDHTTDEQLEKVLTRLSLHGSVPPIERPKAAGLDVTFFRESHRDAARSWETVRTTFPRSPETGATVAAYYRGDLSGELGLIGGFVGTPSHRVLFADGTGQEFYERVTEDFESFH